MRDKVIDNVVYVLRVSERAWEGTEILMCTSSEARSKVKQYATRGIIDISSLRAGQFQDRWDKIEGALTSPS